MTVRKSLCLLLSASFLGRAFCEAAQGALPWSAAAAALSWLVAFYVQIGLEIAALRQGGAPRA